MKRFLILVAVVFVTFGDLHAEYFNWTIAPYEVNVSQSYDVEGHAVFEGGYGEFNFYQTTVEYGNSTLAVESGNDSLTVGTSDAHPSAQTVLYRAEIWDIAYGVYNSYYHDVVVIQPNRPPTVSLTISGVTSAGGATNSFSVSNGTTLTLSTTAADLDGNLQRIRIWANFNGQGWTEIRNVTAGSDSFQYTITGIGTWEFHCRSLDNTALESATAVVNVSSTNRAPSAALSADRSSASVGESVTLTLTVADPDGNYDYANLWVLSPNAGWRWIRADNSLVAGGALDRSYSATPYGAGGSHARTFQFSLNDGFGAYRFALAAVDSAGARTDAADAYVSVGNRAPSVTLSVSASSLSLGQSTALSSAASDADGNLNGHYYWVRGPRPANTFGSDEDGWMDGPRTSASLPSGWSAVTPSPSYSTPQNSANNTTSATFTPTAPGYWQIRANASDPLVWAGAATSGAILVSNIAPTNDLSAPSQVYVGGGAISLTHTANNPTSLANYLTGLRIHERREDLSGGTYQDWIELNYATPSAGNRVWTGSRPAPDRPGRIIYHIRSWNQWMSEWDNLKEIIVQVPNRPPSINVSTNPASIYYGQSTQVTSLATDPDGNLSAFAIMRYDGTWHRPAGIDYAVTGWNPYDQEGGWSAATFSTDAASGFSASKTISYLPTAVGTYSFHSNGHDSYLWQAGGTDWTSVAVNKATPSTSYGNQATAEGVPLTTSQLNAVFVNPYNGSFTVPGTVSYVIIAGGVAPYTNGTALYPGQLLPSATFTVRASVPGSANYEVGQKDITFSVSANPNADNDGDGINNATEIALGTNPNVAAANDPAALQIKIHTPKP